MKLTHVEGLGLLLLEISRLTDLYAAKKSTFVSETKSWLDRIEKVLLSGRIPTAAYIAIQRSAIVSAERGIWDKTLITSGKMSKRKAVETICMQALTNVQKVVSDALAQEEPLIRQAHRHLTGVMISASRKGILNDGMTPPYSMGKLKFLWSKVVADDDIGPAASQVLALIGFQDVLTLIERIFVQWAQDQNNERTDRLPRNS